MDIQSLLNSSNEYQSQQIVAEGLKKKWAKSGLLENLDKRGQLTMAVLLENQAKRLISEANATNVGGASFKAGEGEQWAGIALPLVRKVFAQIAAKDFLSVQPMNLPSGLAFYLEFKYGNNWNGFKAGDSMYGNVSTATRKMQVNEDVEGGLYGAGRFGYSINQYSASYAATSSSIVTALNNDATLITNMFGGQVELTRQNETGSITTASIHGVDISNAVIYTVPTASLSNFDPEGVRAFRLASGSNANITNTWNEFTFINGSNILFMADPTNTIVPDQVLYQKQPVDNDRGDFEAASNRAVDESIKIPEVDVSLASVPIVAKTRKLKAQWTPEFAQDLNAYHSIDAEAELTSVLSEYISMEIDLELLDMLIKDAVTVDYWSAKNNTFWNAATRQFVSDDTLGVSGYYNTQGGWFQTLGTKFQKISNKIHQKTLRGGANWMVCSPTVATILESIPGYAASTDGDKMEFAMGVQKVGSLNSRWKVYKNPYMTENVVLMGYKGTQFLEAGAAYCPYIPLLMTPLVYDPETFTPRKGLMTRFAKVMLRPEFYGKVYISGLETI